MTTGRPRNIHERNAQRLEKLKADERAAEQGQREAEAVHQQTRQNFDHLFTQSTSFAAENPMIGIPTTLFIAWMRRAKTREGQAAIDRFAELRDERGRGSLIPGGALDGVDAADAHDLLKGENLETSWAASPEAAGVDAAAVAPDRLATAAERRSSGPDRGPQLG
ncbi:hypothetical protein SAMN04488550_2927 [Gordonia malaquae]|uniref:Uncharacterized protein n=1 Tax=Gordonia malaquae NBRC 108250 TaxID=1223542 RepID=M3VDX5_GORML|nr:hypothetical protein [Gordonia malaquae]GAC78799.1 hypothetical protein GM1_004_02440 [Gordonia malaquae NBRC 108250]SED66775.1 hypothetical protein SAMN04488550_2927 [Gordonia malaquae]